MARALRCAHCGFTYGFADEHIRYTGFLCPGCGMAAPRIETAVEEETPASSWVVICQRRW